MGCPIRREFVSGIIWIGNGQIARVLVTLATVAILARLLPPEAFGVISAVIAVALVANMIGDFGLGPALTRAPEVDEGMLSCAFWATLALSLVLAGLIAASAGWIAALFRDPALVAPLRVSALIVPLGALRCVPRALLDRALAFRKVALAETAGTVLGALAAIAAALAGAGVWALVIQLFGQAGGAGAAYFLAARWRPRARPALRENRALFRFGGYLTLAHLGGMLAGQASRPIISRALGLDALGLYTVAGRMVQYPVRNVAAVLQRIMLPVFSRAQDDAARLRHMHLATMHGICLIVLPMLVLLATLSGEITALVLGPGWEPVAGLIVWFAVAGAAQAAGVPNRAILLARNRAGLTFKLNALGAGVVILAQLGAVRFGLEAVAMASAAAALAMAALVGAVGFRLIGQSPGRVAAALAPPLASAALMALVVRLLEPLAGPAPVATILLCSTAGLATYGAAEALLDRARFGEVAAALAGQIGKRA